MIIQIDASKSAVFVIGGALALLAIYLEKISNDKRAEIFRAKKVTVNQARAEKVTPPVTIAEPVEGAKKRGRPRKHPKNKK